MSAIFGGKKSQQTASASNQSYGDINNAFSPLFSQAQSGANSLSALLGGDSSGLDAYKGATGFDAATQQGSRGITGNAAASGLLRSGATSKGLQQYGDTVQNQYAQNYINGLMGQIGVGTQAGGLVSGAGQQSQSQGTSSEKPGIGKFLGQVASGVAMSDRRSKKDIHEVGLLPNGLKLYQFRYLDNSGPHIGVMADEVAEVLPEALGPITDGYMTVDYGKISEDLKRIAR